MKTCVMCGVPLPDRPWWKRLLRAEPIRHDPKGPDASTCQLRFNRRLGLIP